MNEDSSAHTRAHHDLLVRGAPAHVRGGDERNGRARRRDTSITVGRIRQMVK
jgi:hypothetical protein